MDLARWDDLVVAGHEIRPVRLADETLRLATESRAIDPQLVAQCKADLDRIDRRVCPGTICKVGPTISRLAGPDVPTRETPREAIRRVQADMDGFVRQKRLEHLIAVNVASTEPPVDPAAVPPTWAALERLLDRPRKCPLPASSLYAIAALDRGHSYINFTPSLGSAPAAIDELARLREHALRGLRRQDRRDAAQERPGPDVRAGGTSA